MIKLKDLLQESDSSLGKIERHFLKKLAGGVDNLPDDLLKLTPDQSKEIIKRLSARGSAQLGSDMSWLKRAQKAAAATKTTQAAQNLEILIKLYNAAALHR